MTNNRIFRALVWVALLICAYLLATGPLFGVHGMIELPRNLLALGGATILLAAFRNSGGIGLMAGLGYLGSFFIAWLASSESTDPGGGTTSDFWIIWTIVYALLLVVAVVLEFWGVKDDDGDKPLSH